MEEEIKKIMEAANWREDLGFYRMHCKNETREWINEVETCDLEAIWNAAQKELLSKIITEKTRWENDHWIIPCRRTNKIEKELYASTHNETYTK